MATGELRERVRERLVSAERGLGARWPASRRRRRGRAAARRRPPDEVALRRERLARGAGRLRRGDDRDHARLLPGGARRPRRRRRRRARRRRSSRTSSDLRRRGRRRPLRAPLPRREDEPAFSRARGAGRSRATAVDNPARADRAAPTRPTTAIAAMRARLAGAVRDELDAPQAARRRHDLRRPADAPARDARRAAAATGGRGAAARALPRRARRRVPGHRPGPVGDHARARSATASVTLVLIGDPKQAIYAFRGADVYAYLEAARDGRRRRRRSTVNWRSDQGLIDAYDALFGGAQLGHEGIVYRQVARPRDTGAAAARRADARAAADPGRAPRRAGGLTHAGGYARNDVGARARRPRRRRRRRRGCSTRAREVDGRAAGPRPAHVAVLVRTNRDGRAGPRRAATRSASPPSSTAPAACSAPTPAREWLRLLEALERPAVRRRARARRR